VSDGVGLALCAGQGRGRADILSCSSRRPFDLGQGLFVQRKRCSGGRHRGTRSGSSQIRGRFWLGHAALRGVSLRQREWDRANSQKQKQVKGASNKMRLNGGVNLFFHFGVVS
jgi:hypothetical protein